MLYQLSYVGASLMLATPRTACGRRMRNFRGACDVCEYMGGARARGLAAAAATAFALLAAAVAQADAVPVATLTAEAPVSYTHLDVYKRQARSP